MVCHDFGNQPLAGQFPELTETSSACKRFPLDLSQCLNCGLLQVTHIPEIEEIFNAQYRYSSSTIAPLVSHFQGLSDWLAQRCPAREFPRVLEFGCNDGVLLQQMKGRGYACTGVDASDNIAALARAKGLNVYTAFFTQKFVASLNLEQKFDVISCSNVFAHIDDLEDITQACWRALRVGGFFCIEVHDGDMIFSQNQFDTIYHEHLTYFTLNTLSEHLERHGFEISTSVRTDMHGGGLRVLAKKINSSEQLKSTTTQASPTKKIYGDLSLSLEQARQNIVTLSQQHGKLWGYGAAGRSQMFINFLDASKYFERIYDDSPLRQGRYIVGTDIAISAFSDEKHDGALVILAWNYAPTIAARLTKNFDAIYTVLPDLKRWV
jgi:2-polyprenyl-3-methyl-5-hydroxy-6-metoxy-1,4-benzoquinol methylase